MRKITAAVVMLFVSFSLATADEFGALIKKVDGNKLTVIKGQKKGEKGEEATLTVAESVKVVKGKFIKEDRKVEAGDAIENGLKNEMFSKGDVRARIITNDAGNVTEIRVLEMKKKGKDL
ncbi:MAG: hypothetical protein HY040_01150 [Planctomycetes bacterium]|nr:hypothetical protein [Planctomycetota bacterium]